MDEVQNKDQHKPPLSIGIWFLSEWPNLDQELSIDMFILFFWWALYSEYLCPWKHNYLVIGRTLICFTLEKGNKKTVSSLTLRNLTVSHYFYYSKATQITASLSLSVYMTYLLWFIRIFAVITMAGSLDFSDCPSVHASVISLENLNGISSYVAQWMSWLDFGVYTSQRAYCDKFVTFPLPKVKG